MEFSDFKIKEPYPTSHAADFNLSPFSPFWLVFVIPLCVLLNTEKLSRALLCSLLYAIALGATFTSSNTQPHPMLTVARTNSSSLEKCSKVKLEMLIKKIYAMDIKTIDI